MIIQGAEHKLQYRESCFTMAPSGEEFIPPDPRPLIGGWPLSIAWTEDDGTVVPITWREYWTTRVGSSFVNKSRAHRQMERMLIGG